MRPKKWFEFRGPGGNVWTVFLSTPKDSPRIFANGKYAGRAFFGGRFSGRVYIDASQRWPKIIETLVHEIKHISHRYLGMTEVLDEAVVNETAEEEAKIWLQIIPSWPEID